MDKYKLKIFIKTPFTDYFNPYFYNIHVNLLSLLPTLNNSKLLNRQTTKKKKKKVITTHYWINWNPLHLANNSCTLRSHPLRKIMRTIRWIFFYPEWNRNRVSKKKLFWYSLFFQLWLPPQEKLNHINDFTFSVNKYIKKIMW